MLPGLFSFFSVVYTTVLFVLLPTLFNENINELIHNVILVL